tara:strand:- start:694 stop:816 length:123 start_codon:yes stop_codon:yes gene_type:complete
MQREKMNVPNAAVYPATVAQAIARVFIAFSLAAMEPSATA